MYRDGGMMSLDDRAVEDDRDHVSSDQHIQTMIAEILVSKYLIKYLRLQMRDTSSQNLRYFAFLNVAMILKQTII